MSLFLCPTLMIAPVAMAERMALPLPDVTLILHLFMNT